MNHKKKYIKKNQNREALSFQDILDRIIQKTNSYPQSYKDGYRLRCPAHDDKHPSFTISLKDNERILIHCFAECSPEEICEAIGIQKKDLFLEQGAHYE